MIAELKKSTKRLAGRRRGLPLVRKADTHRDQANWFDAASLYLRGHSHMPWRSDLIIQAANCYKEIGNFAEAVDLYRRAAKDVKEHGEAQKQIADVDSRIHRLWEQGCCVGSPLYQKESGTGGTDDQQIAALSISGQITIFPEQHIHDQGQLKRGGLIGDLPIDPTNGRPLGYSACLSIIQLGNFKSGHNPKDEPVLVGIVALRIKVLVYSPANLASIRLNEKLIIKEPLKLVQQYADGRFLYIANIWIDSNNYEAGATSLKVEAVLKDGSAVSQTRHVKIVNTPLAFQIPESDSLVSSPVNGNENLEHEVKRRPATIRNTKEMITFRSVKRLLAIRIDQLGDLSASLPALRRLREIFPEAQLVALVAPELAEIVTASNVVDEVIGLTTKYDAVTERRYIADEQAQTLYETFKGSIFDIAIDLCPNPESRCLLLLVDARYRVGFYPQQFPFLDFGIEIVSRDKANDHSTQSHASLIMALAENLCMKTRPLLEPVLRCADDTDTLKTYGLQPNRYIVIHCGARHAINCWPEERFFRLADALAQSTNLKIVIFVDRLPALGSIKREERGNIIVLTKMPMSAFDAMISNAYAMIGNDSGPKHLAAVRGTWTASIHINRLNWSEWGQNGRGIIISKKTPCGGCGLNDERLCGKDVSCLRGITVEEVFAAVTKHMPKIERQ